MHTLQESISFTDTQSILGSEIDAADGRLSRNGEKKRGVIEVYTKAKTRVGAPELRANFMGATTAKNRMGNKLKLQRSST